MTVRWGSGGTYNQSVQAKREPEGTYNSRMTMKSKVKGFSEEGARRYVQFKDDGEMEIKGKRVQRRGSQKVLTIQG